jgi:hypothetical protein
MAGRLLLVVVLGLILVVVVGLANRSGALPGIPTQIPLVQSSCAPSPCASLQGFEADVSNVQAGPGAVTVDITLRNKSAGPFEAVSYRHTSPADFQLSATDGVDRSPVFSADCPDWGQVRVQRRATAGPLRLCFEPPRQGLQGAVLLWSPDVGLFSRRMTIPIA